MFTGPAYAITAENSKPTAAFAISLLPEANALDTAAAIKVEMEKLAEFFPENIRYDIPYDTSPYVDKSITQVVYTLLEAMVLVFIVMYVFLQNVRYTLIPALVVPVAILGAFAVMQVLGMSVNVLTMFAMVLSIGLLVDDAIVVVENVERIMREENLPPREATLKSMGEITPALLARKPMPARAASARSSTGTASVPTLIVWGEEDRFQPVKYAERLAADIANATLVRIPERRDIPVPVEESLVVEFYTRLT